MVVNVDWQCRACRGEGCKECKGGIVRGPGTDGHPQDKTYKKNGSVVDRDKKAW